MYLCNVAIASWDEDACLLEKNNVLYSVLEKELNFSSEEHFYFTEYTQYQHIYIRKLKIWLACQILLTENQFL